MARKTKAQIAAEQEAAENQNKAGADGTKENEEGEHDPLTNVFNHTITQEDLDNNPDLVVKGIVVGEVIQVPIEDDRFEPDEDEPIEQKDNGTTQRGWTPGPNEGNTDAQGANEGNTSTDAQNIPQQMAQAQGGENSGTISDEQAQKIVDDAQRKADAAKKAVEVEPRNPNIVYVKKGRQRNQFTLQEWQGMGANKDGWEIEAEEPQEVKDLKARQGLQ